MNFVDELEVMLSSLSKEQGVFGRAARADAGTVAEHVYRLVLDAQDAWAGCAVKGSQGPTGPDDIADALEAVSATQAVKVMTYLSANDLVFPDSGPRDRAHARRAAERVVRLLGHDATWWTNMELSAGVRAWTPVTRYTFDGVIAGVGPEAVVVLLQVGED
ncbi:hypothetical protein LO771_06850 [Streptacidiphilus sp. ASG 303]|uniref:hypothetical protein n=1 Tax=Streptacidiphilus sp. ASG 303 TaxID=2896847 RepID=UPI001E5BE647|nr:hypothetical protein [Streptacidiphilus sp. ASG 303]MCD0482142.1 hypothetical protein [Streptacidiphilus sp. ASG 303]